MVQFMGWGEVPVGRSLTGGFKEDGESMVIQVLKQKQTVAIFPECCLIGGSFSKIHHKLFSSVINNNNIPVIPVSMQGMDTLKKANLFWEKPLNVHITFSSPIKKGNNDDWSQATVMSSIMEGFIKME